MKSWGGAVGAVALTACGGSSDSLHAQIGDVRAQVQQQEARLEVVKRDVRESEERAREAHEAADFELCRSEVAKISADVAAKQARCLEQVANYNMCVAKNESHTAKAGIAGCVIGVAATVVTDGIGVPLALGGCGLGGLAGEATTSTCPSVTCDSEPTHLTAEVLSDEHLSALPQCGGFLGVVTENTFATSVGVPVEAVGPQTMAQALPLRRGDVVVAVANNQTTTAASIGAVLSRIGVGAPVVVDFLRDGRRYALSAPATAVQFNGTASANGLPLLGVSLGAAVNATYIGGARVAAVAPAGPAARAGIGAGDVIVAADGFAVGSTDDVGRDLRELPSGRRVVFGLLRSGTRIEVPVVLESRAGRTGL